MHGQPLVTNWTTTNSLSVVFGISAKSLKKKGIIVLLVCISSTHLSLFFTGWQWEEKIQGTSLGPDWNSVAFHFLQGYFASGPPWDADEGRSSSPPSHPWNASAGFVPLSVATRICLAVAHSHSLHFQKLPIWMAKCLADREPTHLMPKSCVHTLAT